MNTERETLPPEEMTENQKKADALVQDTIAKMNDLGYGIFVVANSLQPDDKGDLHSIIGGKVNKGHRDCHRAMIEETVHLLQQYTAQKA